MCALLTLGVESGQRSRYATRLGDSKKRSSSVGGENNDSRTIPGATDTILGVGKGERATSRKRHFLEFALGKEGDKRAVRRPEGERCSLGSRQWLGGE
jgi:hypothetical protein